MTLRDMRRAIDSIDEQLVALLNQRAALALEIGRWKRARHMAVYDPRREAEVLRRARRQARANGGPLDAGAIGRLFERVIDEARLLETTDAGEREGRAGSTDDGGRHGRTGVGSAGSARRRRAR